MIYGVFYWASRLSLDSFTSVVLYMGYLLLLAFLEFLVTGTYLAICSTDFVLIFCTGTIGFLATYWAMRKLYGAIRVD